MSDRLLSPGASAFYCQRLDVTFVGLCVLVHDAECDCREEMRR